MTFCRLSGVIPQKDRAFWVESVGCTAARACCWFVGFLKIRWVEVRPNGQKDHIFTGVHSKEHPNIGEHPGPFGPCSPEINAPAKLGGGCDIMWLSSRPFLAGLLPQQLVNGSTPGQIQWPAGESSLTHHEGCIDPPLP